MPRTIWSACFGSTPRRSAISTVSSNFANFTFCMRGTASSIVCGRSGTCCRAAANFFPVFRMSPLWCKRPLRPSHFCYLLASAACRLTAARHSMLSVRCSAVAISRSALAYPTTSMPIDRAVPATVLNAASSESAVQVGHLQLGDVLDLLLGDRADLVLVRLGRALREVRGALQQDRRRRRLGDEAVGPVRVDGHDDRDDQAFVLGGLRVEVLAEVHDIDAVRTERGPDRRRRGGFPRRDLELHHCLYFFRHIAVTRRSAAALRARCCQCAIRKAEF